MNLKGWAIGMGIGAAVGAVAALMLPKQCAARNLAQKAADAVGNAACKANEAINNKIDQM